MRARYCLVLCLALLCLGSLAQAVVIDTILVGDMGNQADTRYATPGYGSVGYAYRIGKYEVTIAQYADFLNNKARSDPYGLCDSSTAGIVRTGVSGGYVYNVSAGWENRPVNHVSYWDAARFANWLGNGQGDGDTETGAYTLNGYTGADGGWIQRNPSAVWCLPSEDEWYKAAYYKGGGTGSGYWDFPTQSDTAPSNVGWDGYTDPGNHANYYVYGTGYTIGAPYYRTNVGEFENSASAYGTFDQGGNVWEWNEALWPSPYRVTRGGDFDKIANALSAAQRYNTNPASDFSTLGFRVAAVPEPSSLIALGSGILALAGMIRKTRRA